MEEAELKEKMIAGEIETVGLGKGAEENSSTHIPEDDVVIQQLRSIRRPLSGAPARPASGFINQFEFYDDAGIMKLAVHIDGAWYEVALTLIT